MGSIYIILIYFHSDFVDFWGVDGLGVRRPEICGWKAEKKTSNYLTLLVLSTRSILLKIGDGDVNKIQKS